MKAVWQLFTHGHFVIGACFFIGGAALGQLPQVQNSSGALTISAAMIGLMSLMVSKHFEVLGKISRTLDQMDKHMRGCPYRKEERS
jgi:uncharacterized membrane protein YoaK (UPF0700 family)